MQLTYVLCSVIVAVGATYSGQCSDEQPKEHVALVQRHASKVLDESPTLLPAGTDCNEGEVLTYDQCFQALRDGIGGNGNWRYGNPPKLQACPGLAGCTYVGGNNGIYYNPNPTCGGGLSAFQAVCAPDGGRKQEKLDFPVDPMPTVELKPVGVQCQPGCGTLTLDQCIKVADDKMVNNVGECEVQLNPGGYGCYKSAANNHIYFNPEPPNSALIQAANKGDVAHVAQHICGVCVTPSAPATSTAVGDPHLVNIRGEHFSIFKTGQAEFIRVPQWANTEEAHFTVHATIESVGEATDGCNEAQYITGLTFGGSWFHGKTLEVNAGSIRPEATGQEIKVLFEGTPVMPSADPINVGPHGHQMTLEVRDANHVTLNVDGASVAVTGHRLHQSSYFLDVEATSFSKLATKIGGLLGEDDHTEFSSKPAGCERELGGKVASPIFSSARLTADLPK